MNDVKSMEEIMSMDNEELIEYFEGYEVNTPEEAFELSILKWKIVVTGRNPIKHGSIVNNFGISSTTCGLCKYSAKGLSELYRACDRCLVGKDEEWSNCFKEFSDWYYERGSASDVLKRLEDEYRKYKDERDKVTIEITKEQAMELLKLIGPTSLDTRKKWYTHEPKTFNVLRGSGDILSCIFDYIIYNYKDLWDEYDRVWYRYPNRFKR